MTTIIDGSLGVTFPNSSVQDSSVVVLQVVNASTSTTVTSTTSTFVATNLTASITPKFSTSKILVFGQIFVSGSVGGAQPNITLYRGSTNLISTSYGFGDVYVASGGVVETILPFSWLDSPATTSSTTYTIYGRNSTASGYVIFTDSLRIGVITLMEIAA